MEVSWQFPGNREAHSKLPGFLERSVSLTRDNRCVTDRSPEARVLVVDDEPSIVELLSVSLKFQGFEVETASDGAGGLDKARRFRPDAVILDVMMPGMDGMGMLRRLRADGIDAPVLFLTAKDAVEDKVAGLTFGADDYVTKPFSLEEVIARLRTILRRAGKVSEAERSSRITFADLELDEDTHEVFKAGKPVSLSPTEFTLLRYLMLNAGTVLSKPRILEHVWNYDFGGEVGVVESYVSYLRRKVDTGDVPLIHTVRGVGYVMREPRI
ncbi:two-component response regulator PhoP [Rhodococcus rhodochrous]|nr:two-component response regulator PhoP [Rhodococcus rhodochrous]